MVGRTDLFSKASLLIFKLLVVELILGGGGRLTAIGPISLRMVLFGLAMACTVVHLARGRRMPRNLLVLTTMFTVSLLLAAVVGMLNESPTQLIWEDIKPLLFFYALPFFYFSMEDLSVVRDVERLVRFGGIALASMFLLVLLLIHTDVIPFLSFYHAVIKTEEFFFRGEFSFIFKGFLYLCIAFIFVSHTGGRAWISVLLAVAILLTVTRGFWASLALTYAVYYLAVADGSTVQRTAVVRSVACVLLFVLIVMYGRHAISGVSRFADSVMPGGEKNELNSRLMGDRDYSDEIRYTQVKRVAEQTSVASAFLGHGFGQGIPERPIHMEIAYLEIFHKQGIAGLSLWGYLFFLIWTLFRETGKVSDGLPFFLSAVFVAIQSAFNQYMNNPIGMCMIIMTLTVLQRLHEKQNVK